MGAGAAVWVLGYRIALLITGGLAFFLADRFSWPAVYMLMSLLMAAAIIGTFRAPEPVLQGSPPKTLGAAVRLPFQEFFSRAGVLRAVLVLVFIVIYKLPEYLAQNMATPFLLKIGFSQSEVGAAQGVIGLIATIFGTFAGGAAVVRIGINRSLWTFALLGAASNLTFYLLAITGKNHALLLVAVIVENFCLGLVNGVFVAFLMSMCNPLYSATQFALLSSLMAASRDILISPAGSIAEVTGWPMFFLIALATVVPGLLLLPFIAPWNRENPLSAAVHRGQTE
jgi:PAT family beta-lactamase induction signal transducer AmpG